MIGAHKVLAAYACLVPRLVTGQFDPTTDRAIWPSTGNYCRGGVAISRILGCHGLCANHFDSSDAAHRSFRTKGTDRMSRYLSCVLVAGLASVPLWLHDFYVLHVLITTGIFIIAAMAEAATHRSAVAYSTIRDVAGNPRQCVDAAARQPAVLDIGCCHAGADRYAIATVLDPCQLGNSSQINQHAGRCQPQIQHRAEGLAACD